MLLLNLLQRSYIVYNVYYEITTFKNTTARPLSWDMYLVAHLQY